MKKIIGYNPLFFAFFLPALVDGAVTLIGQDASYWSAAHTTNEASPAYYFLVTSPWLFLLGSVLWFVFWYWPLRKLKEPLNFFFVFLFVAGHAWGSGSWIMRMFKQRDVFVVGNQLSIIAAWSLLVLYFVIIAGLATYCLQIYFAKKSFTHK